MLQVIRKYIKGWVAFVIFFIISITFVLWGVQSYIQSHRQKPGALVTVYGHQITRLDVYDYARIHKVRSKEALDNLINSAVFRHDFTSMFGADPGQQLGKGIMDSSFMLPSDTAAYRDFLKHYSHFAFFIQSPQDFSSQAEGIVQASAFNEGEKIQAYYNSHQKDFYTLPKDKFEYILMNLNDKVTKYIKDPSSDEMMSFYEGKKKQGALWICKSPEKWIYTLLKVPVKNEAESETVVNELKTQDVSQGFSALLKKHSSWSEEERELGAASVARFNLPKSVGGTSAPYYFKADKFVGVYRYKSYKGADCKSFNQVSAEVKKRMRDQQKVQLVTRYNKRIRELMIEAPDSLDSIANKLFASEHLTIEQTPFLDDSNYSTKGGVFSSPVVRAEMKNSFSAMKAQNVLRVDLLQKTGSMQTLLFRLKQAEPGVLKTLDEVKLQIEKLLIQQESQKLLKKFMLQVDKEFDGNNEGSLPAKVDGRRLGWKKFEENNSFWNISLLQRWILRNALPLDYCSEDQKEFAKYRSFCHPMNLLHTVDVRKGYLSEEQPDGRYIVISLLPLTNENLNSIVSDKLVKKWINSNMAQAVSQAEVFAIQMSTRLAADKNITFVKGVSL
jgi:hypothetical protein